MSNYHAILGVSPGASPEEIKKAYRTRAFETHPDRNDDNDEEFKKVTEAYETLTGKRQEHHHAPPSGGFGGMSPEMMRDLLNNMHTGRRRPRDNKPPLSEKEISFNIQTSVANARAGQVINAVYQLSKDCIPCNGLGGEGKEICTRCQGRGVLIYEQDMGGMRFQTEAPCSHCEERGFKFKKMCEICSGKGWTVHEKRCTFEIKEKK